MKIDNNVRDELMKGYTKTGFLKKKLRVKSKVVLWDFVIKIAYLLKRTLDIVGSLVGIILLSPVFIFTALAIYINDPGHIFYTQVRVGKNGRHFKFLKFRSMVMNADKLKDKLLQQNESNDGVIFKMKKDPRITATGRIIRKYSIDELPQLFNVLVGDMSLVGPRPALPREVAEYTLEDRKRLHAMPGITGIWQISGRSDIPFKEQVELDKEYIKSKSIMKDIIILIKTIPAVITGKGAY